MKAKTIFISTLMLAAIVSYITLTSSVNSQKPWTVTAEQKNAKNPLAGDEASVNAGKSLYMRHCASCHGKTGLGDGPKARNLETFAGDFSGSKYQSQTDGEHFYKTKIGRDEMPGYEGKIEDEDIWAIVNYMRTFKK